MSGSSAPTVSLGPLSDWVPPSSGEVITSEAAGNTYTMGEKIGEGHFGLVFGCVDVWSNNRAAKVLKPLEPNEKMKVSALAELNKLIPPPPAYCLCL
jgi:hypothetical protein